jgi:hypothetical protein
MCACGEEFYGKCIRAAGCEMHKELDPLGNGDIYAKKCVDHIVKYDCPSTLMCSVNCATEGSIDLTTSKIIPFNNYGLYSLRVRICSRKVHSQKLSRYSQVVPQACEKMSDFQICTRWIPGLTFVPVAIPQSTTYLEIDYCDVSEDGNTRFCHVTEPSPSRVYGSQYIFPSTFDVPQTNVSICKTNGNNILLYTRYMDICCRFLTTVLIKLYIHSFNNSVMVIDNCLGSFCNTKFRPNVCSPKTYDHVCILVLHTYSDYHYTTIAIYINFYDVFI